MQSSSKQYRSVQVDTVVKTGDRQRSKGGFWFIIALLLAVTGATMSSASVNEVGAVEQGDTTFSKSVTTSATPLPVTSHTRFAIYDVPGPWGSSCKVGLEQNLANYSVGWPKRHTTVTVFECKAGQVASSTPNSHLYVKHAGMLSKSGQPNWLTFPVWVWVHTGSNRIEIGLDHSLYSPNGTLSSLLAVCDIRFDPEGCGFPGVYIPPVSTT